MVVAFAKLWKARHPESEPFRGRNSTARTFAYLRIAHSISGTGARLATDSGGLTLSRTGFAPAGRQTKFHEGIASSNSSWPAWPGRTNERFQISSDDRVLALSNLSFDLSVYDLFGVLGAGGTIVYPPANRRQDPLAWAEAVAHHQVTLWNTVPLLFSELVDTATQSGIDISSIRLALLSGDSIPIDLPRHAQSVLPSTRLVSLGGATEASIWSIYYSIDEVDPNWRSIPYGKPLRNQQFHVLDAQLAPCPDWVPGDLYISGIGLALGYWRDPERTDASFFEHPQTAERLYRTGDRGQ